VWTSLDCGLIVHAPRRDSEICLSAGGIAELRVILGRLDRVQHAVKALPRLAGIACGRLAGVKKNGRLGDKAGLRNAGTFLGLRVRKVVPGYHVLHAKKV
jgi:hypothetical protein